MTRFMSIVCLCLIITGAMGQEFYILRPSNFVGFPENFNTIKLPYNYTGYTLQSPNYNLFANNIFSAIVEENSWKNIVFSPVSIQTALGLAFAGAQGQTAEDMRNVLKLGEGDKVQVAKHFGDFLRSLTNTAQNKQIDSPQIKIANRLYVKENEIIKTTFNQIAEQYFGAKAQHLDFKNREQAGREINQWIAKQTENKINDIIKPNALNDNTALVLVNAIYFKAKWLHPFSEILTKPRNFQINSIQRQIVETMYNEANYRYIELPELYAKAIELPYQNSNISMLIILPNEVDGLKELENKLKYINLADITSKMSMESVHVYLPKFRIDYEIDLEKPLQKLGLSAIFTPSANFKDLLETSASLYISKAVHKAFLEVNESGSEAAAATSTFVYAYAASNPLSKEFRADRPFMFAIRSNSATYFTGHLAYF